MVTKTINIKESAYHALKAHKRAGESYSDVILRLPVVRKKVSVIFCRLLIPRSATRLRNR